MRKILYYKFILAYVIFFFFGFIAMGTLVSSLTFEHVRRNKSQLFYEETNLLASSTATDLFSNNISIETAQNQLKVVDAFLSASVWIISPSGSVLLNSRQPVATDETSSIMNFDSTIVSDSYYVIGDFFGTFGEDYLSVFSPITSNYKVQGYVVIHTPISDIQAETDKLLDISYIAFFIIFLLSLIILFFFTEIVYIPIKKITQATTQYAAGNYRYKLHIDSSDEIGYLASTITYMAGEVAKAEDNQKNLVANISHDFRSPLTSINGYVVAMKDGTIPPEQYNKYLGIVINETDRLTKLTNSLLTLNNLNTKGLVLEKSVFDINEVIRNTIATFEGTCKNKRIAIKLILTEEIMLVDADILKIQQVLYNLIDNAIKFSHNSSVIKIETYAKNDKLFVSVKDSGIGIPADNLSQIWNRFYKTDLSRGKDKKGTGLGLSITKEIINSHNENINVTSTEGVGTEFTFSLTINEHFDEKY